MPYEPNDRLLQHFEASGVDLTQQVEAQLQLIAPNSPNIPLYRDMILTALRMAQDDRSRWNAKITLQAIRELDPRLPRAGTVQGAAQSHGIRLGAHAGGKPALCPGPGSGRGTGALRSDGDHRRRRRDHGRRPTKVPAWSTAWASTLPLPFEQHANPTIDGTENLLSFHFFFTRKLFFVKEADALVLCPGGFGTLDEALEVLTLIQTGKSPLVPVVLLDAPGGGFWQGALDFIRSQLEANRYVLPHRPEADAPGVQR
jgi:hypothetical protein